MKAGKKTKINSLCLQCEALLTVHVFRLLYGADRWWRTWDYTGVLGLVIAPLGEPKNRRTGQIRNKQDARHFSLSVYWYVESWLRYDFLADLHLNENRAQIFIHVFIKSCLLWCSVFFVLWYWLIANNWYIFFYFGCIKLST